MLLFSPRCRSHVFPLHVPPKLNPIIHRLLRFDPIFHTCENGKHTYLVLGHTSQSWHGRIAYLINALRYSPDINSALPILVRIRDSLKFPHCTNTAIAQSSLMELSHICCINAIVRSSSEHCVRLQFSLVQ